MSENKIYNRKELIQFSLDGQKAVKEAYRKALDEWYVEWNQGAYKAAIEQGKTWYSLPFNRPECCFLSWDEESIFIKNYLKEKYDIVSVKYYSLTVKKVTLELDWSE